MKKLVFLIFVITLKSAVCQINDSPASAYDWKGKKTVLTDGYVILNSGKKLAGQISLQRPDKSSEISGIYFEGDGKEIDFPLAAIKSYGLDGYSKEMNSDPNQYSGPMICDNNEELFTWRDMGSSNGVQMYSTKPRNGYVIKRDGSMIEGELQIKKRNSDITLFVLKSDNDKFKIPARDVGHYGLKITMSEITKNGEKSFSDEARNFHSGLVRLKSGEDIAGFVSFKKKKPIDPNRPGAGNKYTGVFFTHDESSYLKTYTDDELVSITQNINGEKVVYSPYEGGFVSSTTMDKAKYANKAKRFNLGSITLLNGDKLEGEIALPNNTKANYRSPDGLISAFQASEIGKIIVKIDGETAAYISSENEIVEEFFDGNTFHVYENPNPTTVNQKKTNMANNLASLGTSLASSAVLNNAEKSMGTDVNLDSVVKNASTEELIQSRRELAHLNGYQSVEEMEQRGIENENMAKLDAAIQLELASRQNKSNIVIYYDEIVVINKNTKQKMILYKDKDLMNDKLEGLLMGCYSFLELDKKEQKQFYDIDNIKRTFMMLDECY